MGLFSPKVMDFDVFSAGFVNKNDVCFMNKTICLGSSLGQYMVFSDTLNNIEKSTQKRDGF